MIITIFITIFDLIVGSIFIGMGFITIQQNSDSNKWDLSGICLMICSFIIGAAFLYFSFTNFYGDLDNEQMKFVSENINKPEYKECKDIIIKEKDVYQLIYEQYKSCLREQNYLHEINQMKSGTFTSNTGDESHASGRNN